MKDKKKSYEHLIYLLSTIQTKFSLITFWGHGGGPIFGSIFNSFLLSAYDFAKPLLRYKISSFLLWLEGCNLGNIITLLDCYPIAQYMIGTSNSYGSNTVLSHLSLLNLDTKKDLIKSFKKISKLIDPNHHYCLLIYQTKYTPLLIDYLSSIDLSSFVWGEDANQKNIKNQNPNVYNLPYLSPDRELHRILKKLVVKNDKKCFLNIDKFIYLNIYKESLKNTYYKILNKDSKKFYISEPQMFDN
jgi:hypothetical protein